MARLPSPPRRLGRCRVLLLGAGVIGGVYAGRLLQAGHHVTMLACGQRSADLHAHGLVLADAQSGRRTQLLVSAVDTPGTGQRYDLVLVPVQAGSWRRRSRSWRA